MRGRPFRHVRQLRGKPDLAQKLLRHFHMRLDHFPFRVRQGALADGEHRIFLRRQPGLLLPAPIAPDALCQMLKRRQHFIRNKSDAVCPVHKLRRFCDLLRRLLPVAAPGQRVKLRQQADHLHAVHKCAVLLGQKPQGLIHHL